MQDIRANPVVLTFFFGLFLPCVLRYLSSFLPIASLIGRAIGFFFSLSNVT